MHLQLFSRFAMETQARASPGAGRRRLHETTYYHVRVGALETLEFWNKFGPNLARMLLGHDQGTAAANVFLSFCCRMGRSLCQGWRSGCRGVGEWGFRLQQREGKKLIETVESLAHD